MSDNAIGLLIGAGVLACFLWGIWISKRGK